jgi:hypothetical protein
MRAKVEKFDTYLELLKIAVNRCAVAPLVLSRETQRPTTIPSGMVSGKEKNKTHNQWLEKQKELCFVSD